MASSKTATRILNLYNEQGEVISFNDQVLGDRLYAITLTFDTAGTYYFGCQESGLNVYGMTASFKA